MTKIEVKLHWGLEQGSIETSFNKEIQKCFEAKDLGSINLLTVTFPQLGKAGSDVEYDLEYSGGGLLKLVQVSQDTSEKRTDGQ